ncbi:TPA: hypothetical protein OMS91_002861 [Enterobacter kobei]|nr:hypothetical protein [Enterobacter kobei]HCR0505871.1 hypothetical protein [Enterobacter kobei]HCR0864780.1 hypothetical protein [Enterobacter kobei]
MLATDAITLPRRCCSFLATLRYASAAPAASVTVARSGQKDVWLGLFYSGQYRNWS